MRKLLALLVALPLLTHAQDYPPTPPQGAYPPGAYPAPPAPYAQQSKQRDRWYIGFGLGVGDGSVSGQGERYSLSDLNVDDPMRAALNFKVGFTVTPRLLLGLDITAVRAQASQSGIDSATQINNYDAVATFFPWERGFFVRGGVGFSAVSFEFDGESDSYGGTNVLGGIGYAFWLGKQFNLTLNLDASQQFYGSSDTDPESSRFWMLYAGFDWY